MLTNEKKLPNTKTVSTLKEMLKVYDDFVARSSAITDRTELSQRRLDALKEGTAQMLQQIAGDNPNTKSAYSVLFAQLIGE